MLSTALGRFRIIALAEGTSFLLLLGIAMPLKHMMDMPTMVTWVGWAHGLLFILYILTGAHAALERRWSFTLIIAAFVASLVPLATFYLDFWLRRQEREETQAALAKQTAS